LVLTGVPPRQVKATAAAKQEEPEVPFENYKFHSNDIITTLEELQESFKSTKTELEKTEVSDAKDHNLYLQEMDAKIKDLNVDLESTKAKKTAQEAELSNIKQYITQLHANCDFLVENYDLRKAARENEIESLKNAKGENLFLSAALTKGSRRLAAPNVVVTSGASGTSGSRRRASRL